MPRLVVAALRGGAGKSTVAIGLASALRRRGQIVVPYKKGPDYIDAGWLAAAAGAPCYNLDTFMLEERRAVRSFVEHFGGADIAVIEGNRGIFDGMDPGGTFSTARLCRALKAPVFLVLDCTKMTSTAAALVLGVRKFDPRLVLGGVILNRVAGARHESVIREAVEKHAGVPVLGAIPRLRSGTFAERHMGLTPHHEHPSVKKAIRETANLARKYLDIDTIVKIAQSAPPLNKTVSREITAMPQEHRVTIGVIMDSAFQFYYPENLQELQKHGAKIIKLSALKETSLPRLDALYIGGGFPETHAIELSKNRGFMRSLKKAVEDGLPVYAECGGLMYLGRSLSFAGARHRMSGVFPVDFSLEERPSAHGYTVASARRKNPFYDKGVRLKGHEFHYSRATKIDRKSGVYFALKMERGRGIKDGLDGICYKNAFATYTHIHALGTPEWARALIAAALRRRNA